MPAKNRTDNPLRYLQPGMAPKPTGLLLFKTHKL